MGTTFEDVDAYLDPGLDLTVRGTVYTVPLPSAELGLWCRRTMEATGRLHAASTKVEIEAAVERIDRLPKPPGGEDLSFTQRVLGTAYDAMVADDVPDPYVEYCGITAYLWIVAGEDAARRWWQSGGRPEALRPANNRAQRRAKTGGTGTAAATGTRSRANSSGTKSRKTSSRNTAASRSPGKRS